MKRISILFVAFFVATILFLFFPAKKIQSSTISIETNIVDVSVGIYNGNGVFVLPSAQSWSDAESRKWALLRDIIACESGGRWIVNEESGIGLDIGPCQINTMYHVLPAARMGLDIFIPSDNMRYCIHLYNRHYESIRSGGWSPWEATRSCWMGKQGERRKQVDGVL